MGMRPILQNKFEFGIWKKLDVAQPLSFKNGNYYSDLVGYVTKYDGKVSSPILVKLIEKLQETKSSDILILIPQLLSKQRPNDCNPALTAALIYLDMGDLQKANETVDSISNGRDIPFLCCVRAKIAIADGDLVKAKKELMKARCSDPAYPMFYDIIQQIEPTEGWMFRRNIELLVNGKEPIVCGNNGNITSSEALYKIYFDWYRGRKDDATHAMVDSEEYKSKNSEYVLASARMSMDERDWHSAQIMYESLLSKSLNCVYIICEAANSYYRGNDHERALLLYKDAESLDPGSPVVMKGLINTYSSLGMKEKVSLYLHDFMNAESASLGSYMMGAELLIDNKMYSEATVVINKILQSYPEESQAMVLMSKLEIINGNLNVALDAATAAVRCDPKDPDCRMQVSVVFMKMGKYDRAQKELEKAQYLNPENIGILLLMKDVYLLQKKDNDVIAVCKKVLEIDPGNVEAMNAMSDATLSSEGIEASYGSYKEAVDSDNRPENFIKIVSVLIKDGRHKEAATLCYEKERRFGNIATVRRLRGNAEYAMGEYVKASASFASALVLDPGDPIIWHSKGMADEMSGDLRSAEEAYNKAVLMDLNQPEYWISRSSVQEKKGDLKGAVESLNRAIELRPDSVYALVRKGMIFAKIRNFDEALFFIDLAIVTEPDNSSILKIKRDICLAAGYNECAVALCEDIIKMNPKDTEALADIVRVYMASGRKDVALEVIERVLRKDSKSIPLLLIKKELVTSMGDVLDVIKVCEKILSIQPNNRLVKTDLAEAYEISGNINAANRLYSEMQYDDREVSKHSQQKTDSSGETPENDTALYNIARSKLDSGDLSNAGRIADRALYLRPDKTEYILLRARIYQRAGEVSKAEAFLSDMINKNKGIAELWEADGDLKHKIGDVGGALICYESALRCGKSTPGLYTKCGILQEIMGLNDAALESFTLAISKDTNDPDPYRRKALIELKLKKNSAAVKSIETLMRMDSSAKTLAVRAQIYFAVGDKNEVINTYKMFLMCKDQDQESKNIIVNAMKDSGFEKEVNSSVKNPRTESSANKFDQIVPDTIKRYSERLLRRAYVSKTPLSDPDLVSALDLDPSTAKMILDYLADIKEYGEIHIGTSDFNRMEKLSMNAIVKGNVTGLSTDPIISIPCAYVAGGTKDADEAKLLVAYIYKVMKSKVNGDAYTPELRKIAEKSKLDSSIEELVRDLHIGVYEAKLIKENK